MQQSQISIDPTVCHAKLQSDKTLCGIAYFDDKQNQEEIVKESLSYFRLMTFFKNYSYEGPNDILLIYLWVVTAHMLRSIERETTEAGAQKKLDEIAREGVPRPSEKKNFLGGLLKETPGEVDKLQMYLKTLKELLAKQIPQILFVGGRQAFEAKFWLGVSKRKFMNLSY